MKSEALKQTAKDNLGSLKSWILLAVFLAYLIAFFDRSNIMVLIADLNFTQAIGIAEDKSAQGMLMTAFMLIYGVTCFFAGSIVNRWGARKTLTIAIITWGVMMGVMGSVSAFIIVLICRALLGIGQAVLAPSVSKIIQTWFPSQERSKANGVWYVAIVLAPVISIPMIAWFIEVVGWRGSFYILALIGTIPAFTFWFFVRDTPSVHSKMRGQELEQIMTGREEEGKTIEVALKNNFSFLRQGSFWCLTIIYCMMNCVMWGFTTWLPTYFMNTLGFSWKAMGILAALPYCFSAVTVFVLTPFIDRLKFRTLFVIVLALGVTISLFIAMNVRDSYCVVLSLSVALGFFGPIVPVLFTMLQNSVKSNQISQATGFFNGFAYAAAATVPFTMGALYNLSGSLRSGFYLLCAMMFVATLAIIPLLKKKL